MKSRSTLKAGDQLARSDRELVEECLAGDGVAWEALIARYQRLIYSIPVKTGLSNDDAADIFQSVCLRLYEKLSSLRDHDRLSSWLITTTSRECWRLSARRRRETVGDEGEEGGTFEAIPDSNPLADERRELLERQQAVRQGIQSLSERCRDLLTLLFYHKDEFSYAEISRRLDMPVSSIGPNRARCLERLRRLLEGKI